MSACRHCGRPDGDPGSGDHCATCARYLRWELTGFHEAVRPDAPPPRPGRGAAATATVETRPEVTITLACPGDEDRGAGPPTVSVVPGQTVRLQATVRNQGTIVDNYELRIAGLDPRWWTIRPATVYLVPMRSGGDYEQQVEVELHPPRAPTAEARPWPLELTARSRTHGADVATADLVLEIERFEEHAFTVTPQRASGRRRARFTVAVANRGNAPATIDLAAADTDAACHFTFEPPVLVLGPGAEGQARLQVRAPRQRLAGRPLERRFEVRARSGADADEPAPDGRGGRLAGALPGVGIGPGGVAVRPPAVRPPAFPGVNLRMPALGARAAAAEPAAPLLPKEAVFRQRAWLPWWTPAAIPVAAGAAVLGLALVGHRVEVPNVVGSPSVFAAQKTLEDAGLHAGDKQPQQTDRRPPGTVLAQTPGAGEKVDRGAEVTLEVAVGTGMTTVPSLATHTLKEAEELLRKAHLVIGKSSVQPPDLEAPIADQLPPPRARVREGTPVDIVYTKAEAGPKPNPGGAPAVVPGGGKDGGKEGGGAQPEVPAFDQKDLAAYQAALATAGLQAKLDPRFDDEPAGTVIGTAPAPGQKVDNGATVTVRVSSGLPPIAYDAGSKLVVADPAAHTEIGSLTLADGGFPAWTPEGDRIAFVDGGQLKIADPAHLDAAVPLTAGGGPWAYPAFPPTAAAQVVALVQVGASSADTDTDLCVAAITGGMLTPDCRDEPGFSIRDPRWSQGGTAIYAAAVRAPGDFGIVRYRSAVPFSPRRSDWGDGEFLTRGDPAASKGVLDMAVSPDGTAVAAVSNLATPEFHVYLTTPGDWNLEHAKDLGVPGCRVAWRPDGAELVVLQKGPQCPEGPGELVRVPIDRPDHTASVTASARHPAYRPGAPQAPSAPAAPATPQAPSAPAAPATPATPRAPTAPGG